MIIKKMRTGTFCRVAVGVLCLGSAFAAQATTWTYSSDTETITDGKQWTLKVSSFDKTTGTLTFKYQASKGGWTDPEDATSGILDLRSPLVVTDSSDNSQTTVSSVAIGKSFFEATDIVEFYCDIIGKMYGPKDSSEFQGCANMTRIEIGGTAETITGLFLSRCGKLKTIKLNFPNMRNIGNTNQQAILGAYTYPDTIDISTVATPGVTNVYGNAFAHAYWKGDIAFTNIMAIGASAFSGASLTNVFLAGTLATLPYRAFYGGSITNIVLDLPNSATVASATFENQSKIRRVELVTAFSDMSQVTNIVRWSNNDGSVDNLRIYVSRKQWTPSAAETYDADTNQAGFFSRITAQEKAALDEETQRKVIGVLVKGGTRKGIFVHKVSIHDPLGMFIRIR